MESQNADKPSRTPLQQALDKHGEIAMQGPLSAFAEAPKGKPPEVGFAFTPADYARAREVLVRCNAEARLRGAPECDVFLGMVDLLAAHTNDWPIDFKSLHECPDVMDALEFVGSLGTRIDRSTGRLRENWRGKFHIKVV